MMLYYQSWMFYNHFIVILYHFLVLTYWHSAKCQLMFFHAFYIAGNQYQTESKCHETLWRFFMDQKEKLGPGSTWGSPEEGTTHQVAPGGPGAPWWVVRTSGAPRTASLLYKYPNIPETLGESMKYSSNHHRFQNHQIQSRHHLRCGSPPPLVSLWWSWVVLCRPSGP